ncbi:hypothetical protein C0V97_09805, partial [Asaia sp. W19]
MLFCHGFTSCNRHHGRSLARVALGRWIGVFRRSSALFAVCAVRERSRIRHELSGPSDRPAGCVPIDQFAFRLGYELGYEFRFRHIEPNARDIRKRWHAPPAEREATIMTMLQNKPHERMPDADSKEPEGAQAQVLICHVGDFFERLFACHI